MDKNRALRSFRIDALPVINAYIGGCGLPDIFERFIPGNPRRKISPAGILLFLLRNIMLSGFPLYKLAEWAGDYMPELLGIGMAPRISDAINDDRIGRALDELFLADRATMLTTIALRVIAGYRLDLSCFHNDSTTVTFHGAYRRKPKFDKSPARILRGFNKDHRPDLKQLVFNLVVCADGAVPIHFKLHDGNVTDDTTHPQTWDCLRELAGRPDFIYVADSKLCTTHNMSHIARAGGKFITVMPRTRKEYRLFIQWVRENPVRGQPLWYRHQSPSNGSNCYHGYESERFMSEEGYRIIWIRSSQKQKLDAQTRKERLKKTQEHLRALSLGLNRCSLKTASAIRKRLEKILDEHNTREFLDCRIITARKREKIKSARGRPGPNARYKHIQKTYYRLEWSMNDNSLRKAANADGFFPLITNIGDLDMKQILRHYKYQPNLEKRHAYLKSVLDVAPMHLKTPERIEALLFLYYLALVIYGLMERDMRLAMGSVGVKSIPIYPENRECRRPSAEKILESLERISKHELRENDEVKEIFFDAPNGLQKEVLKLLKIPLTYYSAAETEIPRQV